MNIDELSQGELDRYTDQELSKQKNNPMSDESKNVIRGSTYFITPNSLDQIISDSISKAPKNTEKIILSREQDYKIEITDFNKEQYKLNFSFNQKKIVGKTFTEKDFELAYKLLDKNINEATMRFIFLSVVEFDKSSTNRLITPSLLSVYTLQQDTDRTIRFYYDTVRSRDEESTSVIPDIDSLLRFGESLSPISYSFNEKRKGKPADRNILDKYAKKARERTKEWAKDVCKDLWLFYFENPQSNYQDPEEEIYDEFSKKTITPHKLKLLWDAFYSITEDSVGFELAITGNNNSIILRNTSKKEIDYFIDKSANISTGDMTLSISNKHDTKHQLKSLQDFVIKNPDSLTAHYEVGRHE